MPPFVLSWQIPNPGWKQVKTKKKKDTHIHTHTYPRPTGPARCSHPRPPSHSADYHLWFDLLHSGEGAERAQSSSNDKQCSSVPIHPVWHWIKWHSTHTHTNTHTHKLYIHTQTDSLTVSIIIDQAIALLTVVMLRWPKHTSTLPVMNVYWLCVQGLHIPH